MDPTNYRPINLVEPISKIIEKILNQQITKFTYTNKLIPESMQGSVKNRSTALLTSDLLHQLKISVKNFQAVAVVCLDQSAFYDVIDHGLLVNKLKHIKFSQQSINVIQNLLANRKQFVQVNGSNSK